MQEWQTIGLWALVVWNLIGTGVALRGASKGVHTEVNKPGTSAAAAVVSILMTVFLLTLVLG